MAVRALVEKIQGYVVILRGDPEVDRAAEEAVRPFALSVHAQKRLHAFDAPRFKADPERVFARS